MAAGLLGSLPTNPVMKCHMEMPYKSYRSLLSDIRTSWEIIGTRTYEIASNLKYLARSSCYFHLMARDGVMFVVRFTNNNKDCTHHQASALCSMSREIERHVQQLFVPLRSPWYPYRCLLHYHRLSLIKCSSLLLLDLDRVAAFSQQHHRQVTSSLVLSRFIPKVVSFLLLHHRQWMIFQSAVNYTAKLFS